MSVICHKSNRCDNSNVSSVLGHLIIVKGVPAGNSLSDMLPRYPRIHGESCMFTRTKEPRDHRLAVGFIVVAALALGHRVADAADPAAGPAVPPAEVARIATDCLQEVRPMPDG